jgi:hypothetical protein
MTLLGGFQGSGMLAFIWEGMVGRQPCVGAMLEQEAGKLYIAPVSTCGICEWRVHGRLQRQWQCPQGQEAGSVSQEGQEAGRCGQAGGGQAEGRGRQQVGRRQAASR